MNDITEELRTAAARRTSRGTAERVQGLKAIAEELDADVDWDDEAGENWATLGSGRDTLAYVHMCAPLMFVRKRVIDLLASRAQLGGWIVIEVASLERSMLRADREIIFDAIDINPETTVEDFDHERFTASDLWFHGM